MISVVIPLYNNTNTIIRAIHSVQNQTVQDFELIVVDDGSTDNSASIVKQLDDTRITLIAQQNQGVSAARNRGIEEAKYEWVAFLDADDEWKPTFLETCERLHNKYPQCDAIATAYQRQSIDGKTNHIILNNIPTTKDFILDNYFRVAATSDPPFCSISVMIRRDTIREIGGFPVGIKQGEDLLTWARLAYRYKIAYSPESQAIFHTTEAQSQGKPRRIPSIEDEVGRELEHIYKQNSDIVGLPEYIAHWHKMRASIFMRLPNYESQCRNEIKKSITWNPHNKKIILYRYLLLLPYSLRMTLLKHI